MALAGIGVDMLEIARMERALKRTPRLKQKLFTEDEQAYCDRCARPGEHYAARFAAREAVLKALGCGFNDGIRFKDVSVAHAADGRPTVVLAGRAQEVAREQGVREMALSLSFTHDVAVANAVAVTDEVRPEPDEKPDPAKELQKSFRAARSVIDELEQLQQGKAEAPIDLAGDAEDAPAGVAAEGAAAPDAPEPEGAEAPSSQNEASEAAAAGAQPGGPGSDAPGPGTPARVPEPAPPAAAGAAAPAPAPQQNDDQPARPAEGTE